MSGSSSRRRCAGEAINDRDYPESFTSLRGREGIEIDAFSCSSSRRRPGPIAPPTRTFQVYAATCRLGPARTPVTWTPAFERVKKCHLVSFRGAGTDREPGTDEHRPAIAQERSVFIGSGPGPPGHPGMTAASGKCPAQPHQFLHKLRRPGRRSTIRNHSPALRGREKVKIDAFSSSSSRRRPGPIAPPTRAFQV